MHLCKFILTMACALLTSSALRAQTLKTIYEFTGGDNGASPLAGVALGTAPGGGPALYGATVGGGFSNRPCPHAVGCGVIFSLTPPTSPGGTWSENVLYRFTGGHDGWLPAGVGFGRLPGGQIVLYGTTWYGGANSFGTVFALTPPESGSGTWKITVLYTFHDTDGKYPYAGVIPAGAAEHPVLYGTTFEGGSVGLGTVFSLARTAGAWTDTVLHSFTGGADGVNPQGGLTVQQTRGGQTILYGTTFYGGSSNAGTVFALTSPASGDGAWTETILHNFAGPDGANPWEGVTIGSAPASPVVLYGTTAYGGLSGYGTVYSLVGPDAAEGEWNEQVLYSFTSYGDGGQPEGVPVADWSTGSLVLYGTSVVGGTGQDYAGCGTAFSVTPGAAGASATETLLHAFTGLADGCVPAAGLTLGQDGFLYGTTNSGGTSSSGTVYELIP